MTTKNINTNGTKTANWQVGEQLDADFIDINALFQYLDSGDNKDDGKISKKTLGNLYYSVTGNTSNIDFSKIYSGKNKKIDSTEELKSVLTYLENLDTKDVFKLDNPPQTIQDNPPKTIQELLGIVVPKVVSPIPQDIVTKYNLDTDYYKKYANAGGIPVLTASNVSDEDIIANVKLINGLLNGHDDIKKQLIDTNHRVILVDSNPDTAQQDFDAIPDAPDNSQGVYHPSLGLIVARANSAEDYWGSINITAHELIHAMDVGGFRQLSQTYPNYATDLQTLYDAAQSDATNNPNSKWLKDDGSKHYGLMRNTITDGEFVTQIVAAFYGAEGYLADNPDEFQTNFPAEYAFVKEYYGEKPNLVIPAFKGQ
jgi:hypothetical protein